MENVQFPFPFKFTSAFYRFCANTVKTCPFPWPILNPNDVYNPISILPNHFGQRLPWYFLSFYEMVYAVFLCTGLYLNYEDYIAHSEFVAIILHITWCLGHSLISIIRIHELRCNQSMYRTFNHVYLFACRLIESDPTSAAKYMKRWRIADKIMLLPFIILALGTVPYALFVVIFPHHKRYMYLVWIPGEVPITWITLLILFIIDSIFVVGQWAVFFVEIFLTVFVIDTMGTALKCLNRKKADPNIPVEALARTFHQIHILNTFYQEAFTGPFGVPGFKLGTTASGLACISVGVRLSAYMNPIMTLFLALTSISCIGALAVLIPLSASIYENSYEFGFLNFASSLSVIGVLENPPRQSSNLKVLERKLVNSCKPFAIRIGSLYHIQRGTTLTYLSIFLGNLINILIAMSLYSVK